MTDTTMPSTPVLRRRVGRWFVVWTVLLFITVIIGGVTRLTESGLSITEWKPVSGVIPPLSAEAWAVEFEKYRQIPQYRQVNAGMTLAEFQRIFWVEWLHRFWARLVGVAIALPAVVLLARGGVGRMAGRRIVLLLLLMAIQGFMGWYMVASGLSGRTSVSQYRLAAHLSVALLMIGITVWSAADLLTAGRGAETRHRLTGWARTYVGVVALTAVAGAFVAGLDAGKLYNTFPLMGGRVVPAGYGALAPWLRNLFENLVAVQFNHRVLGIAVALGGLALWWRTRHDDSAVGTWGRAVGVMALAQVGLGIATLVLAVPIAMAAMHQGGAVILLVFGLLLLHATGRQGNRRAGG